MSFSLSALNQLNRHDASRTDATRFGAASNQPTDAFRDALGRVDRPRPEPREANCDRTEETAPREPVERDTSSRADDAKPADHTAKTSHDDASGRDTQQGQASDNSTPDKANGSSQSSGESSGEGSVSEAAGTAPQSGEGNGQGASTATAQQAAAQAQAAQQAAATSGQATPEQQVAQAQAGTQAAQVLPGQAAASAQGGQAGTAQTGTASENLLGPINTAQNPYAGTGDGEAQTGQQQTGQQQANQQAVTQAAAERIVTRIDPAATAPTESAAPTSNTANTNGQATVQQANLSATVELPRSITSEDQANVARVLRGMNTAVNQNGGQVNLRLNPPELGVVRIQLEMAQQAVKVQIHAEQDSVRQLMTQQLAQLRHGLESQGLTVERITVQTAGANQSQLSQQDADSQGQNDGRSRGFTQRDQSQGQGQGNDQQQGDGKERRPRSFFDFLKLSNRNED